jgi:hypothetical protein
MQFMNQCIGNCQPSDDQDFICDDCGTSLQMNEFCEYCHNKGFCNNCQLLQIDCLCEELI